MARHVGGQWGRGLGSGGRRRSVNLLPGLAHLEDQVDLAAQDLRAALDLCFQQASAQIGIEPGEAAGASLKEKIAKDKAQLASLNHDLDGAKNIMAQAKSATNQGNVFRGIFFTLTFFTIGLVSNFKKLWEEGIGRLAAVYVISLFGFIIWIGLFISWIFFHGVKPPLAG